MILEMILLIDEHMIRKGICLLNVSQFRYFGCIFKFSLKVLLGRLSVTCFLFVVRQSILYIGDYFCTYEYFFPSPHFFRGVESTG